MKALKICFVLLIVLISSCKKETGVDCQSDQSKRKGARCKDGTTSTATGSGACSSHGGVDTWLCK